jgi:hypothetical protein
MVRQFFAIACTVCTLFIALSRPVRAESGALDFTGDTSALAVPQSDRDPHLAPASASEPSAPNADKPEPSPILVARADRNLSFDPKSAGEFAESTASGEADAVPPPDSAPSNSQAEPLRAAAVDDQIASADLPTQELFDRGSESLVARTVGHAEGTRSETGNHTSAYGGHVDPGNAVWNLGSFSFQHCPEPAYNCSTPEEADVHQLRRLQRQDAELMARAQAEQVPLNLEERLNGIDLANQAPAAALARPGYVEWLKQARRKGLKAATAILEARVMSYWNPERQSWDAPGLGNTEANITHDQNRRMTAIARALRRYMKEPK